MIFRNTSVSSAANAAAICLPMLRIAGRVSSAAADIASAVGRFLISFAAAAVVRMLLVLFAATASAAAAAALWGLVFVVALP